MQLQPDFRESLAEFVQELLRFFTMLKSNDEVVRPAHDNNVAVRLRLSPALDPEVEQRSAGRCSTRAG
jgi:hypothetical protein